ncbi:hypothetical protein AAT96_06625 [Salmonella enterica subsp. enterica]|nr:hypothetical protein [Salmonella enterica subsp. enterica]
MEFFYVVKATQKSGKQDATVWFTAKSEARANLMLDVVLEDAEIETGRGKDYARPIRTNFPVVNELPPEGEISFTFTNYYRLGEDGMTWEQIPGVTLPSSEAAAVARQHIVDGVDTETGEVLEDHTENFGNESNSPDQATAPAPELTVVATMPLRHRVLAQYIGEGEYLYHVDASQKKEILRLEMDTDNSYVQNLLLAAENVEAFKKAIEHDIHKIVNAVKKVFPVDGKTPELATVIQFLKTWFETEHIDRGLLVKEWAKGNRVRPDLELDMGGLRIGADLKTISMWNIKQEGLRAKLHREIIDRDYHLSAAMYCETAALDQFFWIFVNKDENYHWVAIIEASTELLELGMLEYRKTMRAIANGFDTGEWPAPITEDYTDELNDFDVRRLEALRVQA